MLQAYINTVWTLTFVFIISVVEIIKSVKLVHIMLSNNTTSLFNFHYFWRSHRERSWPASLRKSLPWGITDTISSVPRIIFLKSTLILTRQPQINESLNLKIYYWKMHRERNKSANFCFLNGELLSMTTFELFKVDTGIQCIQFSNIFCTELNH